MAVLDGVPGLTVTVQVAGEDLQEFPDNDQDEPQERTTYSFVQAHSGADFAIAVHAQPDIFPFPNDRVTFHMSLDGKPVLQRTLHSSWGQSGQVDKLDEAKIACDDHYSIRRFSFAELNVVEGEAELGLLGKLGDLGSIRLEFKRFRYSDAPPAAAPHPPPSAGRKEPPRSISAVITDDKVPEKNLKGRAISHQAKQSILRIEPRAPRAPSPTRIAIDKEPFATFVFKYRSQEALKNLLVIPRTPSPIPLEERPINDLTADEMRQLLLRQKELLSQHAERIEVKKEKRRIRNSTGDESDGEVEVTATQSKKAPNAEATNAIALSDDDSDD